MSDCEHNWVVQEEGYVRQWSTDIDESTKTITATYTGTPDWSEDGDGKMRLACSTCLKTKPIPDDWELVYE